MDPENFYFLYVMDPDNTFFNKKWKLDDPTDILIPHSSNSHDYLLFYSLFKIHRVGFQPTPRVAMTVSIM